MKNLRYLKDLWSDQSASGLDEVELLRYRSNLLGADLRITNFGGGNTSSKITHVDPLTGAPTASLWVKGSGGDLGSIQRGGFASLYLEKLRGLERRYRGAAHEDEIVAYYPLCTVGLNPTAASIDTPLHGLLPSPHIDHLHPDWGIALAASANGLQRMEEFNRAYNHRLIWVPWQRPGFELALMLRNALAKTPKADGIILGGHGIFTWGETQRACYENTLAMIDNMGQFVMSFVDGAGESLFGGERFENRADRREIAISLFPFLRGRVSGQRRMIGHYCDLPEVLRFVNSADGAALAALGTSCPDHFVRTKIKPLFVNWDPGTDAARLPGVIEDALLQYRKDYRAYYEKFADANSPAMRDANPTVVLIPGVGMFSFGKSKAEARITGEFYTNAIHVMEGATAMEGGGTVSTLPQAGPAAASDAFATHKNYVALPPAEAFRIEYWQLEEAKLRRQPPEKEFSRQVMVVVGGAHGIGKAVAESAAERGAHVVILDRDKESAERTASAIAAKAGKESVMSAAVDIRSRECIRSVFREAVARYGGVDLVINTAAMFASSPDGVISDEQWRATLDLNVTANFFLVEEAKQILVEQKLPCAVVLTSSANAVVPKRGSEAYDVSKAALSHLVRELAVSLSPHVRINAIAPATVVKGSTMFPRDRVLASLHKYGIECDENQTDDQLREKLAHFYAQRNLTKASIDPQDCAEAILYLAGARSRCTTGHVFPVDGGLADAFLR
jgi:rhamnose utilization protein RhaD (predicted bifunctional aldolase and dehydrogenase)/NAD(P)-dependent dehydrogenase (short-subunit alcohol dehydrogenase family)